MFVGNILNNNFIQRHGFEPHYKLVVLIIRLFVLFLLLMFIFYTQHYNIYNNVLCSKNFVNLLNKGYLNNKLFYYYGDIKVVELSYRIQFLLDNFDKINLKTVKYLRKDLNMLNMFKQNPYTSHYHPHFLIELKNNIDNFNKFYLNFQLSTNSDLGFEKLSDINLMKKNKIQYISPLVRVYATNTVEFLENEYPYSIEFIDSNKEKINNYVFKNLKEYCFCFEISKK